MNLAFKDIRKNLGRFVMTTVGIGMLLMIVMGMAGIYRGLLEDATFLINKIGADLWIVQQDTRGPFAELSRVPTSLVYSVYTSDSATPQVCFSKAYGDPTNLSQGYCAVMTCSQADDAGPLVMGCDLRFPIRYEDPKVADNSVFEAQRYDERSAQI